MASNGSSRDSTRFVALFQKAHSHIAALQRLDDQIAAMFDQRRKSIDDLRAVQSQINSEFERVLELDRVLPADHLSHASDEIPVAEEVKAAPEPRPAPEIKTMVREAKLTPVVSPRFPILESATA